jgi:hypothetical protein
MLSFETEKIMNVNVYAQFMCTAVIADGINKVPKNFVMEWS